MTEQELLEYNEEVKGKVTQLVYDLTKLLNSNSEKVIAQHFCEALLHDHRTLQQYFWNMVQDVAKSYSTTEYYDARNEASVNFCKHLTAMVKKGDCYLPII